jgi:hypothetical protein
MFVFTLVTFIAFSDRFAVARMPTFLANDYHNPKFLILLTLAEA